MSDEAVLEELQALRQEVSQLRSQISSSRPDAPRQDGGLSRRSLLRAAPAAALGGAVAMIAGATPASALPGDPVVMGAVNNAGSTSTSLLGGDATSHAPAFQVGGGLAADAVALGEVAVPQGGTLLAAQKPLASPDTAGPDQPTVAIFGGEVAGSYHDTGQSALSLQAKGSGVALTVEIQDGTIAPMGPFGPADTIVGTGVSVSSQSSTALDIEVTSTATAQDAVTISYAGTSRAFFAESVTPTNINGTVTGVNAGHGIGVWGEQRNDTVSGYGVLGVAGHLGRGGSFQGGAAALRLVPSTAATHPSTGKTGDVFVDSTARLWFCVAASVGATPAHWRQVTLS